MRLTRSVVSLALVVCILCLSGCLPPGAQIPTAEADDLTKTPLAATPFPLPTDRPVPTSSPTAAPVKANTPEPTAPPEPTPEPTPEPHYLWEEQNSFAGYSLELPWPSGKDQYYFIVITHTESTISRVACMHAVSDTLGEMYGQEHIRIGFTHPETPESSVRTLASCIPGRDLDGVLLFPMEGADYGEALENAVQADLPVWVFSSEMPSVIRQETRALLEKSELPTAYYADYQINLPWPEKDSGLRIGLTSGTDRWFDPSAQYLLDSLREVYGYGHYQIVPTFSWMGDSKTQLRYLIDYGRNDATPGHRPVDAILMFPSTGTSYEEEIELATKAGIPVWIFADEEKETLRGEIRALHRRPSVTPAQTSAGLTYPTAYTDYTLNLPWPKKADATIVNVIRKEYTLSGTTVQGNCRIALREGLAAAYPDNQYQNSWTEPENGLQSASSVLSLAKACDAVLLFPYDDIDYGPVIEQATLNGLPVWIFSSVDPQVIQEEILALTR